MSDDFTPQEVDDLLDADQALSDEDLEEVAGGQEEWAPGGPGNNGGGSGTGGGEAA
ncbi:MAG TPA: hypothetical protein VMW27_09585 [Thermoanaerobaculia bacterium]|nr:hypothetical protein [Thermoanaerobaculia bacterium]